MISRARFAAIVGAGLLGVASIQSQAATFAAWQVTDVPFGSPDKIDHVLGAIQPLQTPNEFVGLAVPYRLVLRKQRNPEQVAEATLFNGETAVDIGLSQL